VAILATLSAPALATVTTAGDVDPLDATGWTNLTDVRIGNTGVGSLTVNGGDSVSSRASHVGHDAGSTGTASVSGANSKWESAGTLYVGRSGSGTLSITNEGAVSSMYGYVGQNGGSTGTVTVDGAKSKWQNTGYLSVGDSGSGTLTIRNGGAVSNTVGQLGFGTAGTGVAKVEGPGSTWTNSNDLHVGYQGAGTLEITDGGKVVTGRKSYIAVFNSSTSAVKVDGGSTWTTADDLYVGYYGAGTLEITNGGFVSIADRLTIDYNLNGDSWINMSTGGMLALKGNAAGSWGNFRGLVYGTDAINYWNGTAWDSLSNATLGTDYTLAYWDQGDWAGYTVLTVGTYTIPAPSSLLLASAGLALVRRLRRKSSLLCNSGYGGVA
jgi:T5SS/PEP-CTERM-associated repeat protein